jgi:deoxyribodipyrimidine photo-lyase
MGASPIAFRLKLEAGQEFSKEMTIFWVLGRYDRAWGPKRPVFGSVRYMTSDSAKRKLRMNQYLERFGG